MSKREKIEDDICDTILKTYNAFEKSFLINIPFWICYIIIIVFLSLRYSKNTSFICQIFEIFSGVFTTLITMIIGYWIHVLSHRLQFTDIYFKFLKSDNIISKILKKMPYWCHKMIYLYSYYILDFHTNIHHNSKCNKKIYNILFEFIENIFTQSIGLIILLYIIKPKLIIFNCELRLNSTLILLWGFLYATIHLINYDIINCEAHSEHHKNSDLNFGPDFLDIFYNSKDDNSHIEDFNHGIINLIIICIVLVLFKDYKSENLFLNYIQKILE